MKGVPRKKRNWSGKSKETVKLRDLKGKSVPKYERVSKEKKGIGLEKAKEK
jgi:hypothetical protein